MIDIDTVSNNIDQEKFNELRFNDKPFVIRDFAKNWPAVKKWNDDYLIKNSGNIELHVKSKSDYSNGHSKRVTEGAEITTLEELLNSFRTDKIPDMSYVRQAPLFRKSNTLANDIYKPSFFPNNITVDNSVVWIGPENTIAQLHWDPADNFFVQLRGSKELFLVNTFNLQNCYPNQYYLNNIIEKSGIEKFYPEIIARLNNVKNNHTEVNYNALRTELEDKDLSILFQFLAMYNNCHVSAKNPNFKNHPNFRNVKEVYYTKLNPSDAIFIPYIWLHEVHSLETSISLNWFLPDIETLDINKRIESTFHLLLCHISKEKNIWVEYL